MAPEYLYKQSEPGPFCYKKCGTVTTIKISDEMNIDVAPDGTVYGIELLNANEQLAEDHGNLIIETSGSHREIALAA